MKKSEERIIEKLESICLNLEDLAQKNIFYYGALKKEGFYLLKKAKEIPKGWAKDMPGQAFGQIDFSGRFLADSLRRFFKLIRPILVENKKESAPDQKDMFA